MFCFYDLQESFEGSWKLLGLVLVNSFGKQVLNKSIGINFNHVSGSAAFHSALSFTLPASPDGDYVEEFNVPTQTPDCEIQPQTLSFRHINIPRWKWSHFTNVEGGWNDCFVIKKMPLFYYLYLFWTMLC